MISDLFKLKYLFILSPFFVFIYYRLPSRLQNHLLIFISLFLLFFFWFLQATGLVLSVVVCFCSLYVANNIRADWKKGSLYLSLILLSFIGIYFRIFTQSAALSLSYITLMLVGLTLDHLWKRQDIRLDQSLLAATIFFPIIPMGPIESLAHFKKQFESKRIFSSGLLLNSIFYISLGTFKILCIANPLLKYNDHNAELGQIVYGPWLLIYCFLAFMKLYAEFSGFIDVVRGLSYLFGIEVSENFRRPYLSQSPTEIWLRWHITLTRWLRNYIYFPILLRTKSSIFSWTIVLIFVALWHGGGLSYILWSLYWFIIMTTYLSLAPVLKKYNLSTFPLINQALMVLLMSLSTLCFMIPEGGWQKLVSRFFSWSSGSYLDLIFLKAGEGNKTLSALVCIVLLYIFESSFRFKNFFILPLLMLIVIFGEYNETIFFYLGL